MNPAPPAGRMVVVGIDPSLRSTGYGVVAAEAGGKAKALAYGVIRVPTAKSQSQALVEIFEQLSEVVETHRPSVAAVEGVIYLQNYQTAITLGAARGAALLVLARHGLPIFEYAPRRVKAATTGRGGALKQQVAFMVRALLGTTETPPPDAADALAVALAHVQAHRQQAAGAVTARHL